MNVEFCDTPAQAEAAGYRPCKRCQPTLASFTPEADKIRRACNLIQALPTGAPLPGLERLAQEAGLTKYHFHRLFKRETGQTPREYALACRSDRASESTVSGSETPKTPSTDFVETPVASIEEEDVDVDWSHLANGPDPYGFDLLGYVLDEDQSQTLGNIGTSFIYYSISETTYGKLLIAFNGDAVCKLELGSNEIELLASLEASFSSLCYIHSHIAFAGEPEYLLYRQRVDTVVDALECPTGKMLDVPLSLQASGTGLMS